MLRHRSRRVFRRLCLELLEDRRLPAVLTVNTTADDTTADSTLSLREAIELVDGTLALSALSALEKAQVSGSLFSTPDTIDFNIPGAGVHTIQPTSALPAITVPVTIDGYSQPGASANTLATGDNAVLLIQIVGTSAGVNANGLTIDGGQSVIQGLVINNFGAGTTPATTSSAAIQIDQTGGNRIQGNFLGVDPTGATALVNPHDGIDVVGSSYNTIGGTTPADRNVITGFSSNNIAVLQGMNQNSYGDIIEGNFIGTDHTGTKTFDASAAGVAPVGILLNHSASCTIGGTTPGAGNVISGATMIGVSIQGSYGGSSIGESNGYDVVEGNSIGTDVSGTKVLGNLDGVQISDSTDNTVGGFVPAAANLISGSTSAGVSIVAVSGNPLRNQVVRNLIGTDITGKPDLGNATGVFIQSSGNTVGGFENSAENVIADADNGVLISSFLAGTPPLASGNQILSNAIYANRGPGIGYQKTVPDSFVGLTEVETTDQGTAVAGRVVGARFTFYTLQFFTSPTVDPGGGAQALSFLGSTGVNTDARGQAYFNLPIYQSAPSGAWITATATGGTGNTSQLAAPLQLGSDRPVVTANFQGTGKSQPTVFNPTNAQWYTLGATGGQTLGYFGGVHSTDVTVPGDYDATGQTELAVYRPSTAQWFVLGPTGARLLATFGWPGGGDIPVPGDYGGLHYTEPAVFRPSTGQWFVLGPNGGQYLGTFGARNLTDLPVPGDYDGVDHTELAVYRPSTAQWFVLNGTTGELFGTFGGPNSGDLPVPGDYNGVGHTELAVYRPSTAQWFVLGPHGGTLFTTFGAKNLVEIPVVGPAGSLVRIAVNASRSLAPRVSALSAQPESNSAPSLIPLVPSSDPASPLQASDETSGRKKST